MLHLPGNAIHGVHTGRSLAIPRIGKQRHPGGWQHHAHCLPQPPPQAAIGTERITWLQPSPGTVCPTTTQVGSPPVPAQRGRRWLAATRSAARPAPALLQQRHSGGPRGQRRLLQARALGSPQCPVQRRGARQATAPPRPCARPARRRPRAAGSRRPWRRAWGCAGTGSPRPRCGTRTTPPASAPGRPQTQTCSCCVCTRPPAPQRTAAEHALATKTPRFVFECAQHCQQALQAAQTADVIMLRTAHLHTFAWRHFKETAPQLLHIGT